MGMPYVEKKSTKPSMSNVLFIHDKHVFGLFRKTEKLITFKFTYSHRKAQLEIY